MMPEVARVINPKLPSWGPRTKANILQVIYPNIEYSGIGLTRQPQRQACGRLKGRPSDTCGPVEWR